MNSTFLQFAILIAAPLLGGLATYIINPNNKTALKLLLSFSGAYLFGVTVIHLIPETFSSADHMIGAFVMLGFFIQLILEQLTSGVEHGHIHKPHGTGKLMSWSVFIGLSIHAFTEGIPLGFSSITDEGVSNLLFAIAIHKIPAAFALMAVLSFFKLARTISLLILLMFSLMSPAGMALAMFAEEMGLSFILENQAYIQAIVIGLFFHVSTTILFETSTKTHHYTFQRIVAILLGAALSLVSLWGHVH